MSTKEEYEKPEISVCYFEQVLTTASSPETSSPETRLANLFQWDNTFEDDF